MSSRKKRKPSSDKASRSSRSSRGSVPEGLTSIERSKLSHFKKGYMGRTQELDLELMRKTGKNLNTTYLDVYSDLTPDDRPYVATPRVSAATEREIANALMDIRRHGAERGLSMDNVVVKREDPQKPKKKAKKGVTSVSEEIVHRGAVRNDDDMAVKKTILEHALVSKGHFIKSDSDRMPCNHAPIPIVLTKARSSGDSFLKYGLLSAIQKTFFTRLDLHASFEAYLTKNVHLRWGTEWVGQPLFSLLVMAKEQAGYVTHGVRTVVMKSSTGQKKRHRRGRTSSIGPGDVFLLAFVAFRMDINERYYSVMRIECGLNELASDDADSNDSDDGGDAEHYTRLAFSTYQSQQSDVDITKYVRNLERLIIKKSRPPLAYYYCCQCK